MGESTINPLLYYQNNVIGALNLIQVMEEFGVNNFVFSSSATVYGIPKYLPMDESHPLGAINPYGQTKLIIENILQA